MSSLLATHKLPSRVKAGQIGGEPSGSFEQSFASLGYNFLTDRAPRLLEHLLGFQLLDRNDDLTRAVGVYGFQAGNKRLFMPLFFLNGELRGQELLFVQNNGEGQFVPMKENWINFLLSKSPHVMGEASQKDVYQQGGMWPDLRPFTNAYRGSKYSSEMPRIAEWAEPFLPIYAKLITTNPLRNPRYEKVASAQQVFNESPWAVKWAVELCENYPNIKAAMHHWYGQDVFEKALLTIKDRLQKEAAQQASILFKRPESALPAVKRASILPDTSPQDPIKTGALTIMRVDPNERFTHNVPDESRADASGDRRRGSIVVSDKRDAKSKSRLYNVVLPTTYTNPTESQSVEVLTEQGKFEKCLVIMQPYSGKGQHSFATLVRVAGSGRTRNWINSDSTNIWTRPPASDRQHFQAWFDGLKSAKPVKGATYVALTGDGAGTLPFEVNSVLGDGTYRVDYQTSHDESQLPHLSRSYNTGLRCGNLNGPAGYSSWDALLHTNGRKGSAFRVVGGELYIPESAKLLKVQDPPEPYVEGEPRGGKDEDGVSPLEPGNLIDVQNQIIQKTAFVRLWAPSLDEVVVDSRMGKQRLTKTAAYVSLIRDHGLGTDDADAAIEQLAKTGSARFRILYAPFYEKRADGPYPGYGGDLLNQGPSAPREGPPPTGSGYPYYGGAINRYPQEEYLEVPGMNASTTDPWIYNPLRIPDSGTNGPAGPTGPTQQSGIQEAAATGQKEIFDTAVLNNLLNAVRQDSIVDRYLSDLMTGLDRIGRVLFSFYWHMDDVKERYGAADTPELVDAMRNAFETCGDITLKLRQHSMNPDVGELTEPNVEEVARAD